MQDEGDQFLTSNRLRFDIVAAEVGSVASGYDSSGREVAFLAWIAKPAASGGPPRLLVRMSSFETAAVVQDGATAHFDVAENGRVSLGQLAPDGKAAWYQVLDRQPRLQLTRLDRYADALVSD